MPCFPENWLMDLLLFILSLALLRTCAVTETTSSLKTAQRELRWTPLLIPRGAIFKLGFHEVCSGFFFVFSRLN